MISLDIIKYVVLIAILVIIALAISKSRKKDFKYEANDRVCSLYVFPVYHGELEVVDELSESNRGTAWAGSSGK